MQKLDVWHLVWMADLVVGVLLLGVSFVIALCYRESSTFANFASIWGLFVGITGFLVTIDLLFETQRISRLTGTQAGVLEWTQTAEQGVYRLLLDKGLVRIYQLGPLSVGENFIGCTVLDAKGIVMRDVQVAQKDDGPLVTLYDLVDGASQEVALDDLLDDLRRKMAASGRHATAGQR
jgi:hypothetical protein